MRTSWRAGNRGRATLALALTLLSGAGRAAQNPEQLPARLPEQSSEKRYGISGTIVDGRDGRPLADAKVTVTPVDQQEGARSVITGSSGQFLFENLDALRYRLSATRRGYASRFYKQHEGYSSAIVTGPGKTSHGIRFALLPGGVISGTALDEANEAIRNGVVTLFCKKVSDGKYQIELQDQTNTNDEGRYRFTGLDPGDYLVRLRARPWYADGIVARDAGGSRDSRDVSLDVIYPETYFPDSTSETAASPIHVGWGEQASADFSMHPIPSLHLLLRHDSRSEFTIETDREGFAMNPGHRGKGGTIEVTEIGGLRPGPLRLSVPSSSGEQPATTQMLELTANAEIDPATWQDYVKISGVVKTSGGAVWREPSRIWLEHPRVSDWRFDARSDASGQFHFAEPGVQPGSYRVWVEEPEGAVVVGVTASEGTVAGQTVTIGSGKEVKLIVTIAIGAARVRGVVMKDGAAVEGEMILLVPQDFGGNAGLYQRNESNSDGTFEFSRVVPGNYVAVGIADGWELEWSKPEVLAKYLAGGTKVVVGKAGVNNLRVEVQ